MGRAPIPEREVAICERLRLWREKRGMTRKAFAAAFSMKADSFSMYEYARAPLRYELARQILAWFNINPKWLATGEGPLNLAIILPSPQEAGVSPRELFSSVYDRLLAGQVEERIAATVEKLAFQPLLPSTNVPIPETTQQRVLLEESLQQFVRECFWEFSADDLALFVGGIVSLASEVGYHSLTIEAEAVKTRRVEMEAARAFIARRRRELGITAPE